MWRVWLPFAVVTLAGPRRKQERYLSLLLKGFRVEAVIDKLDWIRSCDMMTASNSPTSSPNVYVKFSVSRRTANQRQRKRSQKAVTQQIHKKVLKHLISMKPCRPHPNVTAYTSTGVDNPAVGSATRLAAATAAAAAVCSSVVCTTASTGGELTDASTTAAAAATASSATSFEPSINTVLLPFASTFTVLGILDFRSCAVGSRNISGWSLIFQCAFFTQSNPLLSARACYVEYYLVRDGRHRATGLYRVPTYHATVFLSYFYMNSKLFGNCK